MNALETALREAARVPVLLVASDFDGTLSDLAPKPDLARPDAACLALLKSLASMHHTHASIISGRTMAELKNFVGEQDGGGPGRPRLVGSHGVEIPGGLSIGMSHRCRDNLHAVRKVVDRLTANVPGTLMEAKPASVTFHFRGADKAAAARALDNLRDETRALEGLHVLEGDCVIELCVFPPDKGAALDAVRQRTGAGRAVFLGDDVTDEHAFEVLRSGDVGVKVGPGVTRANHRVEKRSMVEWCLRVLVEERTAYLASRRIVPIERHNLLSDQRTVALIDPRGSLAWLCLPRIDSAAMFASLLGHGRGSWEIIPEHPGDPVQEYVGDTFILRTRWERMSVTDYFDCAAGRAYQRAGRTELIRVIEGAGRATIRFAPRLDFGRAATRLVKREGGLEIEGWSDPVVLIARGVSWRLIDDGPHQTAVAEIDLADGPVTLELRYGTASMNSNAPEGQRREQAHKFWSGWASALKLPALKRDLVRRSALVLKALAHGPTGAIAAAGTTSLPEHLGGERNWDYRFCWPRDACLAASALIRLGNTGIAMKLLDWMAGIVERAESPDRIHPVYTVAGTHLGSEAEISDMPGYGDSRPVRVGNAAANQVQLDVFGPIVELVALLAESDAPITPEHWRLVEAMVQAVALRWQEPDHGIWEIRGPKRHHVHTKAMCWHAVDRAITVAERGMGRTRSDWERLREAIGADVLANGWDPHIGAFTAAYGEDALDASVLAVGLTGLIDPRDDRFVRTVEAIEKGLRRGPTVYRYLCDDGLAGEEGGWLICTAWLIESMVKCGRSDDARSLFDQMCACAGPTGLLAEEFDPPTGMALGNFPQAYSHLGVINAALALEKAGIV